MIVQFIDAYAFDLRAIRKTCVHIVHPDGKRVIPFDTYNMLYRDDLEHTVLAKIRREREPEWLDGPVSIGGSGGRANPVKAGALGTAEVAE